MTTLTNLTDFAAAATSTTSIGPNSAYAAYPPTYPPLYNTPYLFPRPFTTFAPHLPHLPHLPPRPLNVENGVTQPVTAVIFPRRSVAPNPPTTQAPTTISKTQKSDYWGFPTLTRTMFDVDGDGIDDAVERKGGLDGGAGGAGVGAVTNGNGGEDTEFDALAAAAMLMIPSLEMPSTFVTVMRHTTAATAAANASSSAVVSASPTPTPAPIPAAPTITPISVANELPKRDNNFFITLTATTWVTLTIGGRPSTITQTGVVTLGTGAVVPVETTEVPVVTVGGEW